MPSWLHSLPAGPLGNEVGRPHNMPIICAGQKTNLIQRDCKIFRLFVTGNWIFSHLWLAVQITTAHGSHFSASNSRAIPSTEGLELETNQTKSEVNSATMWNFLVTGHFMFIKTPWTWAWNTVYRSMWIHQKCSCSSNIVVPSIDNPLESKTSRIRWMFRAFSVNSKPLRWIFVARCGHCSQQLSRKEALTPYEYLMPKNPRKGSCHFRPFQALLFLNS